MPSNSSYASAQRTPLFVGIGCRHGCGSDVLRQLLDETAAALAFDVRDVRVIASIADKREAPAMRELAAALGCELWFGTAAQLARFDARVARPSAAARARFGVASVAECAALAAAAACGGDRAKTRLLGPRRAGARATVAVATDAREDVQCRLARNHRCPWRV